MKGLKDVANRQKIPFNFEVLKLQYNLTITFQRITFTDGEWNKNYCKKCIDTSVFILVAPLQREGLTIIINTVSALSQFQYLYYKKYILMKILLNSVMK